MRVVMLSKALVHAAYHQKCVELAALPGIELIVLVPPAWREPRVGEQRLELRHSDHYQIQVLPIRLNGRHHLHYYPTIGRVLRALRPDIAHIDEEAFNAATAHAMYHGSAAGARCCFFNWANIARWYPPPFGWFERAVFRMAAHGIAGNHEAAALIRSHGYRGPLAIIPQFGVDPARFAPRPHQPRAQFTIGYVGRLVAEKGVADLIAALALLPDHCHLLIVGDGVERAALQQAAQAAGVAARVTFQAGVPSAAMPEIYHRCDVLVVPSRTTSGWKEQFGRVIIEAMSCGIPVIGTSSGEIPRVIDDAGVIVAEGAPAELAAALQRLAATPALAAELAQRGRARVLAHYTQRAIARATAEVYAAMRDAPPRPMPAARQ